MMAIPAVAIAMGSVVDADADVYGTDMSADPGVERMPSAQ